MLEFGIYLLSKSLRFQKFLNDIVLIFRFAIALFLLRWLIRLKQLHLVQELFLVFFLLQFSFLQKHTFLAENKLGGCTVWGYFWKDVDIQPERINLIYLAGNDRLHGEQGVS